MIRIEVDEFTVDIPIDKRMTAEKFLEVADRLERLFGRGGASGTTFSNHAASQENSMLAAPQLPIEEQFTPTQHAHVQERVVEPSHMRMANIQNNFDQSLHEKQHNQEEFRFEQEEEHRLEYFMNHISHQLQSVQATQERLETLERSLASRMNLR